jgi:hypothetical protein
MNADSTCFPKVVLILTAEKDILALVGEDLAAKLAREGK